MGKYVTATECYYLGASQVEAFIKKEIGTKKKSDEIMSQARAATRTVLSGLEEEERKSNLVKAKLKEIYQEAYGRAKPEHHRQNEQFQIYSKRIHELFSSKKKAEEVLVGEEVLQELIKHNNYVRNTEFFDAKDIEWNSKSGARAMKKFTDILLWNDLKKLEYCKECQEKTKQPISLKAVFGCPTPAMKTATEDNVINLARAMKGLEERLSKTESLLHVNSPEYDAMKAAMKSVNQGLATGLAADELGSRLEALQAASMKYVKAKGVGMQVTGRGKERMDAVLDLCALASDGMDYYISRERRAELASFEKEIFDKTLSKSVQNNDISPVESVFPKEEKSIVYDEEQEHIIDLVSDEEIENQSEELDSF